MSKNLRKVFNNVASLFELTYPVLAPFAEAGKAVVKNNGNVGKAAAQSVVQQETQSAGDSLANAINDLTGQQEGSLGATTTNVASQLLAQQTVSPALSKALGVYPKSTASTVTTNSTITPAATQKAAAGGASGGVGGSNVSTRPQLYPWVRPGEATPSIKQDTQGIA